MKSIELKEETIDQIAEETGVLKEVLVVQLLDDVANGNVTYFHVVRPGRNYLQKTKPKPAEDAVFKEVTLTWKNLEKVAKESDTDMATLMKMMQLTQLTGEPQKLRYEVKKDG